VLKLSAIARPQCQVDRGDGFLWLAATHQRCGDPGMQEAETQTDAHAMMLIYLMEQKLIENLGHSRRVLMSAKIDTLSFRAKPNVTAHNILSERKPT
jgi:hypothetical protein